MSISDKNNNGTIFRKDVWQDRSETNRLGWDTSLLKTQVAEELDEEMRREADNQARSELERLKSAYDRDRGRKSKGKRKTARKAAKKAKRGRKEKDLTPDRTLESLIEELVQVGIIRSYPKVEISDFWGFVSVVDPLSRKWKRDTFPGLGDIRCTLIENCILTLGKCRHFNYLSIEKVSFNIRLRAKPFVSKRLD